jgi:uncharacterized protein DUF4328
MWNGTEWVPNQPGAAAPQAAYGPTWARPYESARFRATMATIFLGANVVGILLLLGFDGMVIAGGGVIGTGTDAQVIVEGLVALIALIVYYGSFIPAIVFFCMWDHRVVRNMPALGSPDPRWSPSGAVVRCFIPFLNLIHPLSSVLDAWRGADPSTRWTYVQTRKGFRVPSIITGWWASWLIGGWVSNIGGRMTNSDTSSVVLAGAWISILASLVLVAAAALAIMVVRDVTARQDRKNELITSGQLQ